MAKILHYNNDPRITAVEIPKSEIKKIDFALCKQPKETLSSYYSRQFKKPDFLINGGFFCMEDGKTCFNYIDEQEAVVSGHWYTDGMGVIGDKELVCGQISDRDDWRDYIAAYPMLIEDGKPCPIDYAKELNYSARRSVLAYNGDYVYLVTVESPDPLRPYLGMKFIPLQDMLLELGVTHAINLDGGGSTKLLHAGKCITSNIYNRPVDNVVAVYLKQPLRRVQVGAWRSKALALIMQARIRRLPDNIKAGYAQARCVPVDGWWKVQVGAYSTDEAAELVQDDLAKYGITETFIAREV